MARQPFEGKMTITQYYHDSTVVKNGKKVTYDQNALDLSPRNVASWKIKAPLIGSITAITKEIAKVLDGYFEIKTKDGFYHCFVHSLINTKISKGFASKEGGYIGDIDKTPVNASGAHCHYFILDKNRKPVDIIQYYINLGIYPNDWLLDPNKLIPKGRYVMSKPTSIPIVHVDPCEQKLTEMRVMYETKLKEQEGMLGVSNGTVKSQLDKLVLQDGIIKNQEEKIKTLTSSEEALKSKYELFIEDMRNKHAIEIAEKLELIKNLEQVNLSLRKKRNMDDVGSVFTYDQIIRFVRSKEMSGIKDALSSILTKLKTLFKKLGE
jgi:hypothetical protein